MSVSIEDHIRQLFAAFPSLSGWFNGLSQQQQDGIRQSWRRQIGEYHESDVAWAVGEILNGHYELPANYEFDRTGSRLRQLANIHSERRIQAERLAEFRRDMRAGETTANAVARRCVPAMRCAMEWGQACRDGKITGQQNADAMIQVHQFHKRGDIDLPQLPQEQPCQPHH